MNLDNVTIDVICLIDKTGKIEPLKIRIESDDSCIITTKVNEVVYTKENNYAGFTTFDFGCKVTIDDINQLLELRYNVNEHKWKINKVVWK